MDRLQPEEQALFGSVPLKAVVGDIEQFVMPVVRGIAMEGIGTVSGELAVLGKADPDSGPRQPNRRGLSLR